MRSLHEVSDPATGVVPPDIQMQQGLDEMFRGNIAFHWKFKLRSAGPLSGVSGAVADNERHLIPKGATDIRFVPEGRVLYTDRNGRREVHRHGVRVDGLNEGVPYVWEED